MPASIGVNLRVTGHCRQGGRKYMEDFFSVAYQQTEDEKDLEYAFFGIYDGHGGGEAATYAKEHLMESIVRQKNFWSEGDEEVLKAIKDGYINTHYAMWKEQENWPKTASGLPSTAGTTASVAFIRRGKIYIGHVGDSGIILGYQEPGNPVWQARPLTEDHKPENKTEMTRIEQCGGKVVTKSGIPRVVWNRPRIGHKGPVRRSTPIDEIPFLAVARSLGDLWSYNSALDEFVVSPDPDTVCIPIDPDTFRCLIFGTDGLWNMISPATAVGIVQVAEQHNENTVLVGADQPDAGARASKVWINPSKCLVEKALERWSTTKVRADNTSVITLMLDPPGPPRAEVIKNQRLLENRQKNQQFSTQSTGTEQQNNNNNNNLEGSSSLLSASLPPPEYQQESAAPEYPETGLEILTMYAEESGSPKPEASEHPEQSQQLDQGSAGGSSSNDDNISSMKKCTDDYLEKVRRAMMNTTSTVENVQVVNNQSPVSQEKIQINEVSSSCSEKFPLEPPCLLCSPPSTSRRSPRSLRYPPVLSPQIQTRSTRTTQNNTLQTTPTTRGSSAAPQLVKSCTTTSKREHSDSMTDLTTTTTTTTTTASSSSSLSSSSKQSQVDSTKVNNTVEPPPKLRRSQSLGGARDYSLRSSNTGRCLRDRDRTLLLRNSLVNITTSVNTTTTTTTTTTSAAAAANLKKLTTTSKNKQAMQAKNRLKRLNNK